MILNCQTGVAAVRRQLLVFLLFFWCLLWFRDIYFGVDFIVALWFCMQSSLYVYKFAADEIMNCYHFNFQAPHSEQASQQLNWLPWDDHSCLWVFRLPHLQKNYYSVIHMTNTIDYSFTFVTQLQLSEVIMQTRHYMMDMVGGHGTYTAIPSTFHQSRYITNTFCFKL